MFSSLKNSFSKPKKPMISSFSKFIIFMVFFFGIIGALFTVFTLNNPDTIKYISNINPSTVLYVVVMGFVALIILSFILGILSYFLFDINGSTMFWLFVHLLLLMICSPYFLIVLLWGIYKFLTKKTESSSTSFIQLGEKGLKEKSNNYFGNIKFFGTTEKKEEEERKKKEKEDESKNKKEEEGKGKRFFNLSGKKTPSENNSTTGKDPSLSFFGGGAEDSSLEKFTKILLEIDEKKLIFLWDKLLYIYKIQNFLLDSSLSKFYNKMMHP